MKAPHVFAACLCASVASAVLTTAWLAPATPDRGEKPTGRGDETLRVRDANADAGVELTERVAALEMELAELRLRSSSTTAASFGRTRTFVAEDAAPGPGPVSDPDEERESFDVIATMRRLEDPLLTETEKAQLWREVREHGHVDAVLAELERRVQGAPYDADLHADLGLAYLNKMLTMENGLDRGAWGERGATAFAEALEIDETNWDARFALAQHQWWADLRGDSIQNLELLVAQQKGRTHEPKHSQAYLWLGNIYMDRGKAVQARATWSSGLSLFPGDVELAERLAAFE